MYRDHRCRPLTATIHLLRLLCCGLCYSFCYFGGAVLSAFCRGPAVSTGQLVVVPCWDSNPAHDVAVRGSVAGQEGTPP